MLLFYIRHGDPVYEPDSLTEQGMAQAVALAERMKICNPDTVFASSSERALLTARPTAESLGLEIQTLDWCHEIKTWRDYSVVNKDGKRTWYFQSPEHIEMLNSEEMYRLGRNWCQHPMFRDTTIKAGAERIRRETDAFLRELGYDRRGNGFIAWERNTRRVALFAHQGFGLAFLSELLEIPYPQFCTHFDMGHTGLTVIQFAEEGFTVPKVLQLSNDSHIFASDKLETKYQNSVLF